MMDSKKLRALPLVFTVLCGAIPLGCSRAHYRTAADHDAARLVVNASAATRAPWDSFTVAVPPESRFFDGDNPDRPPMPPDDPAAHRLMHCVDCKPGYPCWHAGGVTQIIENPHWQQSLPWSPEGEVVVDLETAIELGLYHSRDFQDSLEDLYLSALDVSAERFRFDVQYFGGNDTFITAAGRDQGGGSSSTALATGTSAGFNKAFAAGGQLLVGFANNFVWQFAGDNTVSANSLLNFTLVQPLLRGGGRALVMERLTISERALLANVRAMERFRRGFYVDIAVGTNGGASGPNRRGGFFGSSGLSGFTGLGGGGFGRVGAGGGGFAGGAGAASAGGYLGVLQDQRELRNAEANVASLQDSVELLDAFREANRIDRFQVDLARQALYNAQSQLLTSKAGYQSTLDGFKQDLGLPPELPLRVEDDLLDQFELLSPELIELQTAGTDVLSEMWSGDRGSIANAALNGDLDVAGQQGTRDQLLANIAVLESIQNLLELYRFRPNAAPQDPTTVAQYQDMLDGLIDSHRRLLLVLDPLQNYGPVMTDARQLQDRALASLSTVSDAVDDLEQAAPRRIEILELLAASEPVQSGEVDPTAFSVDVFQQRRGRLARAFDVINQRLRQPEEAWDGRRLRIEGLHAPAQAAQERIVEITMPLVPIVEQLEQAQAAVRNADPQDRDQANQVFFAGLEDLVPKLANLQQEIRTANVSVEGFLTQAESTLGEALQAVRRLADDASEMGLIQARARLETAILPPQTLTEERAFAIACEYRRDWMNARMNLVDNWRLIEFNADDLESDLDITFSGDLGTSADNPFRFRDANGSLTAGLAFDAPLQRLIERNDYRQSLIEYQQAKRSYVRFVDGIRASLRNILRTQELNVLNFELRRRSVHVAIDQVELTRLRLYEPPRPGETAAFGETTARDLVSALTDLLDVQNDFLSVWVNFEVQRMLLDLSLGTMELDERGLWLDPGPDLGDVPLACEHAEVIPLDLSVPEDGLDELFGNPPEDIPPPADSIGDPDGSPAVPNPFDIRPSSNSDRTGDANPGAAPLRLQLPNLTMEKSDKGENTAGEKAAQNDSVPRQASHMESASSAKVEKRTSRGESESNNFQHTKPSDTKPAANRLKLGRGVKKKNDPLFGDR
ncbi:MAG: TolC family protein [Pirellulales bacterium]|nr:TolC family protein [Pirellulales bacterium]